MNFLIPIKLAFKSFYSNPGRTAVSLLGIIIGVASIVLVLSFGMGVKNYLIDQVSVFGTDIMQIEVKVPKVSKTSVENAGGQVGGTIITTLKLEEAEKIASLPNVYSWYAMVMNQQVINYGNKNKRAMIFGVTEGVFEADPQLKIASGKIFSASDGKSLRQSAIIGSEIKEYFFGENEAVGKSIKIKNQEFEVIAVLEKRGGGIMNFDEIVYLPLQTVQKKIAGINHIQGAIFKLKDMQRLEADILSATEILRAEHKIRDPENDDFAVNSIVEVLEILDKVFVYVNWLLIALASISLVVGGVGIMNVMYVAVTERTFEIGLKKAVGAKKFDILAQFLFEAIFIAFAGGLIGLAVGFFFSNLGEILIARIGFALNFEITWLATLIGVGFSALVGIIFGYFPARKASKMSPIEALRKE